VTRPRIKDSAINEPSSEEMSHADRSVKCSSNRRVGVYPQLVTAARDWHIHLAQRRHIEDKRFIGSVQTSRPRHGQLNPRTGKRNPQ
jgi:hypothetical protein